MSHPTDRAYSPRLAWYFWSSLTVVALGAAILIVPRMQAPDFSSDTWPSWLDQIALTLVFSLPAALFGLVAGIVAITRRSLRAERLLFGTAMVFGLLTVLGTYWVSSVVDIESLAFLVAIPVFVVPAVLYLLTRRGQ